MALTEISLSQEDGLICQIFTRTHIVTADDPPPDSEDDEGPTPLELFLASLGSSSAVALRIEAERLGIDVEEVQISVKWRTSHRRLLDPGEVLPSTAIQREIRVRVTRDISEAERDSLLEAAKTSPVSRVLGDVRVEDALYVMGYADPDSGVVAE